MPVGIENNDERPTMLSIEQVDREAPKSTGITVREYRPGIVLNGIFARYRKECQNLTEEAARQRGYTITSPIADVLDYAAARLSRLTDEIEHDHNYITVQHYADLCGASPQSVRSWIKKGELKATLTANGFLIPRNAKRQKKGETRER